ncbi:MAG: aminomethyl-transferring glycine dehydrogenase subunit GcvPA [Spirochaetes bacterium]|nr:aminomethyl-transferring glycine dehydrogenase subunit GcvPA [Spirochaetota bacterium]
MYTSITEEERREMLRKIGVSSIDELFADIPAGISMDGPVNLPGGLGEMELLAHMEELAGMNHGPRAFIGAGGYSHYIPALVDHLSSRSEFYTSYTPYQAEVSQGTLVAIFEYQTMIARLCGTDIANASMYDGATATAEAAFMAMRSNGRKRIVVSSALHPHYREVLKTYAWASDSVIDEVPLREGVTDIESLRERLDDSVACVIVQSPNFLGAIEDSATIAGAVHSSGAILVACVTEPMSLGLLRPPGALGADIVCGEGQAFGNPVGFGGPMLGFLAAQKDFMRRMPGRLVGKTVDAAGQDAYVLTLQAREQHIRRDRATSNICTNQGLCALRAVLYLSIMGGVLRNLAALNHRRASYFRHRLLSKGFAAAGDAPYFNEFVVRHPRAMDIRDALMDRGMPLGLPLGGYYPDMRDCLLLCVTELDTVERMDRYISEIEAVQ